jgi:ribonuclease J
MTSLTFYGGVNEIGGNKILVEDKDTHIFLDFGMSFGKSGEFFSEFLMPKKCNGVNDYISLGLVPDLKGLYRPDYLEKTKKPAEEPEFDGILLSHAHFDHNGFLNLVRPDIPLYCSEGSRCVMEMLDATSKMSEFLRQKVSFKFVDKKRGEGVKRLDSRDPEGTVKRDVKIADKPFSIGSFKITPIPVNHSLPGALAFAVETSSGTIIYSGDYRFHGYGDMTEKFVEKASSFDPVALITEGTRIRSNNVETEKEVYDTVTEFAGGSRQLVIANFPVRDTDRMLTFQKAAQDNDRRLVVDLRQAYLLKTLEENGVEAPRLKDVDVYACRKSWGLVTEDVDKSLVYGDYDPWESEFIFGKNAVTCKDISGKQGDYVFRCEFFELKELMDIQPHKDSHYIWSVTEPFDVKMELNEEIVMNWLKHFNITKIVRKHVSGHANGNDIKRAVETINPKKVYPVHTDYPGKFREFKPHTVRIKKGKTYNIE